VLLLLLEHGVNLAGGDPFCRTALHWAAARGYEAAVWLLLDKGANIAAGDCYKATASHWAAGRGYEAVVQLLVEKGAGVAVKDEDGRTALYWALERHKMRTDFVMLEMSEDDFAAELSVDMGRVGPIPGSEDEALHYAIGPEQEAVTAALVRLLLEKGVDVAAEDRYGQTALYRGIYYGHEAVVRLLLENGADIGTMHRVSD
jgi:ankyrin repeat protein